MSAPRMRLYVSRFQHTDLTGIFYGAGQELITLIGSDIALQAGSSRQFRACKGDAGIRYGVTYSAFIRIVRSANHARGLLK